MSAKITDKDRGFAAVGRRLAAGKNQRVHVGILADAPKDAREGEDAGALTLLEVAAIHEFGAPAAGIPQRSFIRGTVDARRQEINDLMRAQAVRIAKGQVETHQALEQVGAKVVGMIQQGISRGIEPANAPETVERKGSSKPLVDTGQLRSAVTYKVEKG